VKSDTLCENLYVYDNTSVSLRMVHVTETVLCERTEQTSNLIISLGGESKPRSPVNKTFLTSALFSWSLQLS